MPRSSAMARASPWTGPPELLPGRAVHPVLVHQWMVGKTPNTSSPQPPGKQANGPPGRRAVLKRPRDHCWALDIQQDLPGDGADRLSEASLPPEPDDQKAGVRSCMDQGMRG